MTEAEWGRVDDEEGLWRALAPLGRRRRRLLASALVRALGHWVTDPAVVAALEANDLFADTSLPKARLRRARDALFRSMQALERSHSTDATQRAEKVGLQAVRCATWYACADAVPGAGVREAARAVQEVEGLPAEDARRRLYSVYREVAGPTPAVAWDPGSRTSVAVQLAAQMYESRDFGAMPILADALQDAGCENDDILSHCRGDEPHVRGCWVVDLVLGKE
jgi:hypothetical protein